MTLYSVHHLFHYKKYEYLLNTLHFLKHHILIWHYHTNLLFYTDFCIVLAFNTRHSKNSASQKYITDRSIVQSNLKSDFFQLVIHMVSGKSQVLLSFPPNLKYSLWVFWVPWSISVLSQFGNHGVNENMKCQYQRLRDREVPLSLFLFLTNDIPFLNSTSSTFKVCPIISIYAI